MAYDWQESIIHGENHLQKEDHEHTWMAMIVSSKACEDLAIFTGIQGDCGTEPVMATKRERKMKDSDWLEEIPTSRDQFGQTQLRWNVGGT